LHNDILPALRRKEKVVLIGAHGLPRWSHWQVLGAVGPTPADGFFFIHSGAVSLLELVTDPQLDRYRFRAEVCQGFASPAGSVGVYLAHSKHPSPIGDWHCLLRLNFADWGKQAVTLQGGPKAKLELKALYFCQRQPLPYTRTAELGIEKRIMPWSVASNLFPSPTAAGLMGAPMGQGLFPAAALIVQNKVFSDSSGWRQLTVEVTPEVISVYWEERQWVGGIVPAVMVKMARQPLLYQKDMVGVDPPFSPQGGLGLFVEGSAAFFRNVMIEPIQEK
jgi:hypothetical protein